MRYIYGQRMNKKICSACSCKAALHHFNIIEEWMAFRFMSSFGRIKVCSDKEHNEPRPSALRYYNIELIRQVYLHTGISLPPHLLPLWQLSNPQRSPCGIPGPFHHTLNKYNFQRNYLNNIIPNQPQKHQQYSPRY